MTTSTGSAGQPRGGARVTVAVRASDADRARVADILQQHTAAGRLTLDEYEQRVGAAWRATTLDDLAALTTDLPAQPAPPPAAPPASAGARLLAALRDLCCCTGTKAR